MLRLYIEMRLVHLLLGFACGLAPLSYGLTPNLPAREVEPHLVVNTRIGPIYNAVRYSTPIVVPKEAVRQRLCGHGVYVVEIGTVTGYPVDVRVLQSSGHRVLDDAVAALPVTISATIDYKATIPIDFSY